MVDFILQRGFWNVKRHAKAVKTLQNAEIRQGFVTFNLEILDFVNLVIEHQMALGLIVRARIVNLLKKMGLLSAKRHAKNVRAPQTAETRKSFVTLIMEIMDFASHA